MFGSNYGKEIRGLREDVDRILKLMSQMQVQIDSLNKKEECCENEGSESGGCCQSE